jgi:hypothetical protein
MKYQYFKTLFLATFVVSIFTSCDVDGDVNQNPDPDPQGEESFKDLIVSSNFDWNTSDDYTINFQGNPVSSLAIERPLVIKIEGGEILRKVNTRLTEDESIDVRVPSKDETLVISWGSFEKTITLGANPTIDFTFIEPDTQDD